MKLGQHTLGQHTYSEIMSQPQAWSETLKTLQNYATDLKRFTQGYEQVIFTGCGSTYYLALAAAALYQETIGIYSKGLPASEIWLYANSAYNAKRKTLLVAVSRSGTTTETLRAVEHFKKSAMGTVITFSCYPTALSTLGHLNIVLAAGQEESIAQTRAFTVLYLATVAFTVLAKGEDLSLLEPLSTTCQHLLATQATLAKRIGSSTKIDRFYFLGSGPRYGLACELSLKMKEMTLSHSEPFHFMEFRHGPQSMVTDTTLMIGLVSEVNGSHERAVLNEMQKRGAEILSLADSNATIVFNTQLSEAFRNVLYLPVIQLLAYERSISKGLNPDKPNNLEAVVLLDA
jgi:glutamine---fructose-6-phosphate transaminase (isomerizing)